MAITNAGYDGPLEETSWADVAVQSGTPYAVRDYGDWLPTVVGGADRMISIAPGEGFGHGVVTTSTAAETVQMPAHGSGSVWHAIVCHRDWTTNTSTFTSVPAGTSPAWPSAADDAPGEEDDQPIALVRITAGEQLPTEVRDIRAFASKVITASAWGFGKGQDPVGTVAIVNGALHHMQIVNGSKQWINRDQVLRYWSGIGFPGGQRINNDYWTGFLPGGGGVTNTLEVGIQDRNMTIPVAGVYTIRCQVAFAGSSTGKRTVMIVKNPSETGNPGADYTGTPLALSQLAPGNANYVVAVAETTRSFAAGDRVKALLNQTTGATHPIYVDDFLSNISIVRLGDA